jgi:hypothetical protein
MKIRNCINKFTVAAMMAICLGQRVSAQTNISPQRDATAPITSLAVMPEQGMYVLFACLTLPYGTLFLCRSRRRR